MDCATRPTMHRVWRSARQCGGLRRGCAVRVLAFHDGRSAPQAASTSSGPAASRPQQTLLIAPLSVERIDSLSPSALAASLLDYARQNALESSFNTASHPDHSSISSADESTVGNLNGATSCSSSAVDIPGSGATPTPSVVGDHGVYDAAARQIAKRIHEFDAAPLVDVLEAFSRADSGRGNRDVLAICCAVLTGKVDDLCPTDLSRLAAACAALDLQSTDLLSALCSRAGEPEVLSRFSAPDLAALLEALSRLQHRSPTLFADAADVLATELQLPPLGAGAGAATGGRRQGMSPEQVVAAVWATASAGLYHRPLFDGAGALLLDRLEELGPNAMARTAWAFATIRHADESHRGLWDRDLFDSIAWVGLERGLSSYPPRALVTLLWSFASIPHYDGPLFDSIALQLAPAMGAGAVAPADLVAVAWAVQRVAHAHVLLMEALGAAALEAVEQLDGDDLTTIAMAFPAAKAYSEGFFKYLVSEAQARPQFFGQVALLDIIRLISRVQYRDPKYYGPALEVLLDHVHNAFLDAPIENAGCMNPFRFG